MLSFFYNRTVNKKYITTRDNSSNVTYSQIINNNLKN